MIAVGCWLAASVLIGVPVTPAEKKGTDWAQFRGPGGLGVSAEKGLPATWSDTENIAWKAELPGAGTSSPIVYGDRIYLTCYSGFGEPGKAGRMEDLKRHLVCLDRKNGKVLWSKDIDSALPDQERIREEHGYASSTPAADEHGIYCFFGKTGVFAFSHEGKQLWQADVGSKLNGWGSAASVVLAGDLVIVNASVESESLAALDRKSGKEVWRVKGIRESWNAPILVPVKGDQTELVLAIMGKVLAFDPKSGQQRWSCDTDIRWYMVPGLVAHDGIVYCIGGRSNQGLAVRAGGEGDVTASNRLWKLNRGSNVSSPIYHDGHLYWINDAQGVAYCADAANGKVVWEERMGRGDQVYASPVLADGKIYFLARTGRTFVVAAKPKFELLATNDFNERGQFNASPAVAGGRLLIRSNRYLYCIGAK